jgi:hypothetical protein
LAGPQKLPCTTESEIFLSDEEPVVAFPKYVKALFSYEAKRLLVKQ